MTSSSLVEPALSREDAVQMNQPNTASTVEELRLKGFPTRSPPDLQTSRYWALRVAGPVRAVEHVHPEPAVATAAGSCPGKNIDLVVERDGAGGKRHAGFGRQRVTGPIPTMGRGYYYCLSRKTVVPVWGPPLRDSFNDLSATLKSY
jgi:hypothetical protein